MISRDQFDPDACTVLSSADLSHETGHSFVYSAETKQRLAETVEQMAELCAVLTKVLTIIYPPDDVPACRGRQHTGREMSELQRCKEEMKAWYRNAQSLFADFGHTRSSPSEPQTPHDDETSQFDPVPLSVHIVCTHY